MEKSLHFLETHKRTLLVAAVAYVLYVFSQIETYDIGGIVMHVILNALIFMFVAQAVVTFAEKAIADRQKKTI